MKEERTAMSPGMRLLITGLVAVIGIQGYLLYDLYRQEAETNQNRHDAFKLSVAAPGQSSVSSAPVQQDPSSSWTPPGAPWFRTISDDWDPFSELQRMREEISHIFDNALGRYRESPISQVFSDGFAFSPQLDLKEDDDAYTVTMDIPGSEKSDISVKVEDRILTVSGKTSEINEETTGHQVIRRERRSGQFERALTLPGPVQSDAVDARYEEGVLTIRIPKASGHHESRTINIT